MAQKITPMMKQYLEAKSQYPDTILFFRMGDFYELFYEDAKIASRVLNITLTSRNKKSDENKVPMAGVPHHSVEGYVSKLLKTGHKVALCDQLEDPTMTKGIVARGVVRVMTPGLVVDGDALQAKQANYLAAVTEIRKRRFEIFGLSYLDISTGEFKATEIVHRTDLAGELKRIGTREVVIPESAETSLQPIFAQLPNTECSILPKEAWILSKVLQTASTTAPLTGFNIPSSYFMTAEEIKALCAGIIDFGFSSSSVVLSSIAGILSYLIKMHRGIGSQIRPVAPYRLNDYVVIDDSTRMNLELFSTMMGNKKRGSLLWVLDDTVTSMGARLLRNWLSYPLVDIHKINDRLDAVGEFKSSFGLRDNIRTILDSVHDIERLLSKVSSGKANAKDLRALEQSLSAVPDIKKTMAKTKSVLLSTFSKKLDDCDDIRKLIDKTIVEDPPAQHKNGGYIKPTYNKELAEVTELSTSGKNWLLKFEVAEKKRTKINSLKVKYNKVFGYFIEVTRSYLKQVPKDYIRKQTLVGSERFITPELKEYETKILNAETDKLAMEIAIFEELRSKVGAELGRLREISDALAIIDVFSSFAEIADRYDYCRPKITNTETIEIADGRHPVVERTLTDDRFVPNSVQLDCTKSKLLIITGPNMAGKSTIIRQVALITLMAQVGCFVPAKTATIGSVDKIFSRVGASDNLAAGHSTFMVEMTETAHILKEATDRSLIILDEIGRGTSTFDGLSIAWSVAEYIHDHIGAKTLFATHYHELIELESTKSGVKNFSIAVKEWNDTIIFLRKIVQGPSNRSYGIQVGRLAGLPVDVVDRAKEILSNLETSELDVQCQPKLAKTTKPVKIDPKTPGTNPAAPKAAQLNLFGVSTPPAEHPALVKIKKLPLNSLTPIDALNMLYKLRKMIK